MDSQYKTIHPTKYLQDYFAQEIRPDGRQFLSFRPISINVGSIVQADSSTIFKLGNTTVVCGIKAELAVPKTETPDQGYFVPNVELSSVCSSKFRPGPPSKKAQIISKMMEDILINSFAIDLKDLLIFKNKLAWVLYCDLLCINYDGSVLDACTSASTAALKTLTLPEVNYNVETGGIIVHPTKRIPFLMKAMPVSTTFALFDKGLLIADPTDEEESSSLGSLSIVMDESKICYIHKPGGIQISQKPFMDCLSKARKRTKLVQSLIETAISSPSPD